MKITLIVMAAGLASRYGGHKQTDAMGPKGEMLLEYSVADAIRAGFERIVFVIRAETEALLRERFADCGVECCYAIQGMPEGFAIPPEREKPYGTVHAVLSAEPYVDGPFAVINADDYYGPSTYQTMYDFLVNDCDAHTAALAAFCLKNTLSPLGCVTRGVCRVEDGYLTGVTEVQKVNLLPDGSVIDTSTTEVGKPLDPDLPVSMNFWGCPRTIFDAMREKFAAFMGRLANDDLRSEYPLPVMMDRLIHENRLTVRVLTTDEAWFGVTYLADRAAVRKKLATLPDPHERSAAHE